MAGFVEPAGGRGVVPRFSGTPYRLPYAMSWAAADRTNKNGTAAAEGSYHIRLGAGWLPREVIVCAGDSEILRRRAGENTYLLQPKTKLGVGGATLVNSDLDNAQVTLTPP